jgi:3-dehydroquinate synthase
MTPLAPGSYAPCLDREGRFDALLGALQGPLFAVADARVLKLHPHVARALKRVPGLALKAGEGAKSLRALERLGRAAVAVPRTATVLAVGGGTIGDLATVFAHLHKRGARLIHVPTTWLAAVDSSVGGKGAVNVGGLKNALGVFHAPAEGWLCPELFTTLSPAQRREGEAEAFKMALALDETVWRTWRLARPDGPSLIRTSRALKAAVVLQDPYEQSGLRACLNLGHTLGHVVESVTRYRVRHGEAVALGLRCALDLSRAEGLLAPDLAADVEAHLPLGPSARRRLASALAGVTAAQVGQLLRGDKKGATATHTRFILLRRPGRWEARDLPNERWRGLLPAWKRGARP